MMGFKKQVLLALVSVITVLLILTSSADAAKKKKGKKNKKPKAKPLKCFPANGVTQKGCQNKIKQCPLQQGIIMKWTGAGCRNPVTKKPLKDGGCQCNHYCGYMCEAACEADPQCYWRSDRNVCYVALTNMPGPKMPKCYQVTAYPSQSPSTSAPTTSPVPAPSTSPTPPTIAPSSAPTTPMPSQSPTTRHPSRSPTTSAPTESPVTSQPTRSPTTKSPTTPAPTTNAPTTPCGVCQPNQSCVVASCVGLGNLQISMTWSRVGQVKMWVFPPIAGSYVGENNLGMPNIASTYAQQDRNGVFGMGPNNIFWSNTYTPPSGTYKVCAETWSVVPDPKPTNPITITVTATRPNGNKVTFSSAITTDTYQNPSSQCRPGQSSADARGGLVGTFNYPF